MSTSTPSVYDRLVPSGAVDKFTAPVPQPRIMDA
jgi:hypothetical protein